MNALNLAFNSLWLVLLLLLIGMVVWIIRKQRQLEQKRQARQMAILQDAMLEMQLKKLNKQANSIEKTQDENKS